MVHHRVLPDRLGTGVPGVADEMDAQGKTLVSSRGDEEGRVRALVCVCV